MACITGHMSQYQKDLYKERQSSNDPRNLTYSSDVFQTFVRPQNEPKTQSNNLESNDSSEIYVKAPWGRARSYAGDGPICLPTENRPKCEPPLVLQKTHHHFGSGLFAYPRGYPFSQHYDLTYLKKSNLRWNDELIPRPSTSQIHDKQIQVPFPQEHPLSSHMSRQALFPTFDNPKEDSFGNVENIEKDFCLPSLVPADPPSTIVVHKAMGSFARREICTPQTSSTRRPLHWQPKNLEPLPIRNAWFSRHEVISEFNKQYPSVIPKISFNIQTKKSADWLTNRMN